MQANGFAAAMGSRIMVEMNWNYEKLMGVYTLLPQLKFIRAALSKIKINNLGIWFLAHFLTP